MERRTGQRVSARLDVECRVPATPERARLHDISRTGCRVEFTRSNLDQGATISFCLHGARPVGGEIVWTEGAYAGVRFSSAPRVLERAAGIAPEALAAEPEDRPSAPRAPQGHRLRRRVAID